jgi:uncharacterized protein YggE
MKFIPIVFLLSVTTPLCAEPEIKGTPAELTSYLSGLPKLVSITGESEIKVAADRAMVTLKISTESKSLQESLRMNQEARSRVVAFLKEGGFGTNQVQAARFSSTQNYGIFAEKAKSHRVDNFLRITVRDEKEFQTVANTVDRWPEVHFLGIDFEHTNKEAIKAGAQVQACDNAGERKKLFEEKLGVKLSPKRFSEAAVVPVQPDRKYYDSRYASFSGSKFEKTTSIPGRGAGDGAIEDSVSPFGELVFSARITVEYAVESR